MSRDHDAPSQIPYPAPPRHLKGGPRPFRWRGTASGLTDDGLRVRYQLRNVPHVLWRAAWQRAKAERKVMRRVLIELLDAYAAGWKVDPDVRIYKSPPPSRPPVTAEIDPITGKRRRGRPRKHPRPIDPVSF